MTSDTIKSAIFKFLQDLNFKKSESDRKKLTNETDPEEIEKLKQKIAEFDEKYSFSVWMAKAANEYAKQLKFGTHISKGIHPDSKGDNINLQYTEQLSDELVGSQSIKKPELDANGNAAALPLAAFFNIIIDEEKQVKLRDLLLTDDPVLAGCFADDFSLSEQYKIAFQTALNGDLKTPTTHERNKQLLWVNNEEVLTNNDYICLVPLYPSSLTNAVYRKINQIRYSEQNKQARDNRYKRTEEQQPYVSFLQLATTTLGGSKPQNVSQLTSLQGGRNYLLPSLPPIPTAKLEINITAKQSSIFTGRLAAICYKHLLSLYDVVEANKNLYNVRDQRKEAIDLIAQKVLEQAALLQKHTPGWTQDYQLDWEEKYWLDPKREEDDFQQKREQGNWIIEIERRFGLWINHHLKKRFPQLADDFNQPEYNEWRKKMKHHLTYHLRHSD